jgi:hypothetical protein
MSTFFEEEIDPREELLAGLVLGDLTAEELANLGDTTNERDAGELIQLERAAAALQLALQLDSDSTLPEELERTILSRGVKIVVADRRAVTSGANLASQIPAHSYIETADSLRAQTVASRFSLREIVAWCACAVAVLAALGIWQFGGGGTRTADSALSARAKLISEAVDLLQVAWADGKTPLGSKVTGDVVWSNDRQSGFMRFFNLPPNDPSKEQYQLWIIDPQRDDEPIDGGVFDVTSDGETIVPIQAKLKVLKPAAFAITIEKPGGVVVSTQERLPLLAVVK